MNLVNLDSNGKVRTITLNAPDRLNALDWPLLEELKSRVETVAADPEARALVVTGAGRAFCAGADLNNLFGDRTRSEDVLRKNLLSIYASFLGLRELSIPTIAAVDGPAVGAGLNIALACSVIIAGPNAGFGPTFSKIGLHPGGGCTWMLTQRIGAANAAAALYSGKVISSEEAFRLGIAQEIVEDPRARAAELAQLYAQHEAEVMTGIKQSIHIASTSTFDETIEFEATVQAQTLKSKSFEEFISQFAQ